MGPGAQRRGLAGGPAGQRGGLRGRLRLQISERRAGRAGLLYLRAARERRRQVEGGAARDALLEAALAHPAREGTVDLGHEAAPARVERRPEGLAAVGVPEAVGVRVEGEAVVRRLRERLDDAGPLQVRAVDLLDAADLLVLGRDQRRLVRDVGQVRARAEDAALRPEQDRAHRELLGAG